MRALRPILALIGFTAVTAQVVLMRELLVLAGGAEISLGLVLGSWLLWTALGSGLLGRIKAGEPRRLVAALEALIALALPLTILAARAAKSALQTVPGEIPAPGAILLCSLAIIGPFCALSGWLFAAGSRLYGVQAGASIAKSSGTVYLLEAAGSAAGGVLASLFLIRTLDAIGIAFLLALAQPPGRRLARARGKTGCAAGGRRRSCVSVRASTDRERVARPLVAWLRPHRGAQLRLWQPGAGGQGRQCDPLRKRTRGCHRARSRGSRASRPLRAAAAPRARKPAAHRRRDQRQPGRSAQAPQPPNGGLRRTRSGDSRTGREVLRAFLVARPERSSGARARRRRTPVPEDGQRGFRRHHRQPARSPHRAAQPLLHARILPGSGAQAAARRRVLVSADGRGKLCQPGSGRLPALHPQDASRRVPGGSIPARRNGALLCLERSRGTRG